MFNPLVAKDLTSFIFGDSLQHMKLSSVVWRSLVGVACMGFILSTATAGENKKSTKPGVITWNKVVMVKLTGSQIPQRVIIRGQRTNGTEPMYIVQNDELHRTGANSIAGMLALDPSININSGRTH